MITDFYRQQSVITDPGDRAFLYADVPDDLAAICRVVQGLLVHFVADGYTPPQDRLGEVDTRYINAMLGRIVELDERPLTEARPIEKRLVGCCRDYAVLTVSILRHKGIPARGRYGTSAYFEPGYFLDHVILEYWNGIAWIAVDSEMGPAQIEKGPDLTFDVLNVPDDQFLRGGAGWLMCRKEGADPDRFGLGSESPLRGWEFVVTEMLLDLAALNRVEMLCWDEWGFANRADSLSDDEKGFLDTVAEITLDNDRFEDWRRLFQHEHLHIPPVISSYTPAAPPDTLPVSVQVTL